MKRLFLYIMLLSSLTACHENILGGIVPEDDSDVIHVDGIDLSNAMAITSSVTTRATNPVDAETIDWLLTPLKQGLDVTYGKVSDIPAERQESVAILRLEDSDKENVGNPDYDVEGVYAQYTFNLRDANGNRTETHAKWHGNGAHYFEGLYVPQEIRYTTAVTEIDVEGKAPNLVTDQSAENYYLLSHYLGMAANTRLSATIERVKLPFRHRLAHVMAFILIDPILGGAKIDGYMGEQHDEATEDPTTSSIYFRNVRILRGVKDVYDDEKKIHTLTPLWGDREARITPHFYGELGSLDENKNPRTLASDNTVSYADNFIMYINNDVTTTSDNANIYPSSDKWPSANTAWTNKYNTEYNSAEGSEDEKKTAATNVANSESGYTRVEYGKVPVYDIIVRPTYSDASTVMYDEDLSLYSGTTDERKSALANIKNQIDFDITLDNGLQYTKEFEFDLNANHETMVYLRISREGVDYNDSGSAQWITDEKYDGWYGLNNDNGNTLSKAGSSWQRAYTYVKNNIFTETPGENSGVTDGQFYNASTSHEEQENAQYFTATYKDKWVEKFLQAYKGGKHHGDYFALRTNIEIDASLIPIDYVFTGHLDAQNYTITLTGGIGIWVACNNEVLSKLKVKTGNNSDDMDYEDVPQLYWFEEIAQAPGRRNAGSIPWGDPIEFEMDKTYPADLVQKRADGYVVLYKVGDKYEVYSNTNFYKKTAGYLFDGLDGEYTTNQEEGKTPWEANVHKETNDWGTTKTHWVPTMGYRAETLNVKMASGNMLFKEGATITGNVQNCRNGDSKIPNVTPELPDYK